MKTETSNSSKTIKVGILGFGTVGQGTWKHLEDNASFWPKILGVNLVPIRASVRSLNKQRSVEISLSILPRILLLLLMILRSI